MDEMFGGEEMQEILHDFLVETEELLDSIDQQLIELEESPECPELLNSIFRSLHTIKGASGFLGLNQLVEVAHIGENLLDKLRQGSLNMTPARMDALLSGSDMLRLLATHIKEKDGVEEDTSAVLEVLRLAESGEDASEETACSPAESPDTTASSEESSSEESSPETGLKSDEENPGSQAVEVQTVESTGSKPEAPREAQVKNKAQAPAKKAPVKIKEESETIRVDTERLDSVMNMVGELVLGRNRLMRLVSHLIERYEGDDIVAALNENATHLNLITTDLQLSVMKTRMQPIAKVFGKFPRMVRDLAKDKGKEITLELVGQDTELDKTVIEEIGDPLVHLVRNAVDHGVEMPDDREKAGKDRKGTVTLSAFHKGNNICVSIEDDGKGIDVEVLKKKALEKNLLSADEIDRMTDKELFNIIFMPGFSTAAAITDTSGRGVGMDVVKTNISRLNGSIDIESKLGGGSRMNLSLPLTLAIIQALMIGVGDEEYALPLSSVVEILKVDTREINTVEGREALYFRDKVYPLLRLSKIVDARDSSELAESAIEVESVAGAEMTAQEADVSELTAGECSDEMQTDENTTYVVLMAHGEKVFGLLVEKLLGQEEVVIKSMGSYLSNIKGVSGATITGDGRVVLIIDVVGLFSRLALKNSEA